MTIFDLQLGQLGASVINPGKGQRAGFGYPLGISGFGKSQSMVTQFWLHKLLKS